MTEKAIDIETPDGSLDAQVFYPAGPGPWPAVILHTDIRGVRPTFAAFGRRLADEGYFVLLPNLFYRLGLGRAPLFSADDLASDDHRQARMGEVKKAVTVPGAQRDHTALLAFLAAQADVLQPWVGIVGYCMSGSIALRAAADFPDRIVAAASFHGGRLATDDADSPHLRAAEIKAPLYLGYAENDKSMPPEAILRLETALRAAGVFFQSEHFLAGHGFAVPDSAAYAELAAETHWAHLTAFLGDAFAPS